MKPHGLNLSCKLEIENVKRNLGTSKLEGYIELGSERSKVVIPMRSFVRSFLDIIHSHFTKSATYSVLKKATAPINGDTYGILIGSSEEEVEPTNDELPEPFASNAHSKTANVNLVTPSVSGENSVFAISRSFTNLTGTDSTIYELGVQVKDTNTASATTLIARDRDAGTTIPTSDSSSVTYTFQASHPASTGGLLLNAIKFIYNTIFNGSVTASTLVQSNGSKFASAYATGATAVTASYFAVTSAIADNFGIVVGYEETTTSPNTTNMTMVTSNLTKTATTVGSVTINGSVTSFTITRDFTNTGTTNISLNRIGILTKSLIYLAINNTGTDVVLQPNQKLRVTYTLSTTC